jgi:hypothetical protein
MKSACRLRLALALALAAPPAGWCAGKPGASASPAQSYRWVDEQGGVHYSDQIPPDQARQRRSRLDSQAREVEVVEAAKTPEQLRRERQLRELRAQQDKILGEQRDRDLSLLRTYRNEQEMYRTLQGRLDTLDGLIKLTEANRQHQQEILLGHERRAADLERQGQAVPQSLRDLIAATRKQLQDFSEKIRHLEADKREITERFAKDIARYRAIAAQRKNPDDALVATLFSGRGNNRDESDEIIISAIPCAIGPACDRAWGLAKEYILKQVASGLSLETERILQTPTPATDEEFGLTVTRIAGKTEDILFLDARCRPSSVGEALCAGEKLREVRLGFKPYIEAGLAAGGGAPAGAAK